MDLSNGIGDFILIGKAGPTYGNHIRRGLIMTEFNVIPSSAIIVSAELVIIGASGNPQYVSLHRALTPWGEGLSDAPGNELAGAPATSNDATWSQSQYGSTSWTNLGGDFDPNPTTTTLVKPNVSNVFSGPAFTADIQGWVDGSLPNHGWIMIGNETQSGSVIGLNSGDINSGIPYINVKFKLPARQILINEVNPSQQWVELHNSGPNTINIDDWYLCNNGNCDQVNSTEVNFLHGTSSIPSNGYVRIAWNDITLGSGEIALMKSASTSYWELMEDYVQYGGPNQARSYIAKKAGLWNERSSFVTAPAANLSIGLDAYPYTNGEDTDQGSWEEQFPTPSRQNVCYPYLNLTSPIQLGVYAANQIDFNGVTQTGSGVGLNYSDFVEFLPNSEVSNGTVLQAVKRDCTN